MEVLGHAQLRTTTGHLQPRDARPRRDAVDRMGRALWDCFGTGSAPAATTVAPRTTQAVPPKGNGLIGGVELKGLEPLTPTLPGRHDRFRRGSLEAARAR